MTTPDSNGLVPLRPLLRHPEGPLYGLRHREVPQLVGPIIRRKTRYSRFRTEYVRVADVTSYLEMHS